MSFSDSPSGVAMIAGTTLVVVASAIAWRRRSSQRTKAGKSEAENVTVSSQAPSADQQETDNARADSSGGPACAWEERRQRGIPAASSHVKQDAAASKPFGSSYYYAHNSTRSKGGYADGLRMEDYTMNGPRLLSRGGKPVDTTTATARIEPSSPTATP
jgi:hypothetical protein